MIIWREARVESIGRSWKGAIEVTARIHGAPDEPAAVATDTSVRALAYPDVVGTPEVGDRVLLNCSALARGLGTGGYALVIAIPDRLPPDPPGPGHLVKARYSPLQTMVLGVDEQDSAHHGQLRDADSLDGMPVLVADLHSALPAILAGIHAEAQAAGRPPLKVAYVMTDGAALPAAFSRTVAALTEAGLLAGTITVGQAYGGDLEAVTLHTGLLAAQRVLGADIAIVAQGPGNLGTGTRWGFSGVAAGEAINAVAALGGRPVASLRVSMADPRPRHRGVSHHSLTAYGRVAMAPADVIVPQSGPSFPAPVADLVAEQATGLAGRHRLIGVATYGLRRAMEGLPVTLSTMGRSLAQDATPFLAAAAAGRWAARMLVPVPETVWHLALDDDLERARAVGHYDVSTRGLTVTEVGYLHASLPTQIDDVAAAFYGDLASGGACAVELDVTALREGGRAVVMDPADPNEQAGTRYPHVYGSVPRSAVLRAVPWRGSLAGSLAALGT